jgi:hydroxypyruvate isomerase
MKSQPTLTRRSALQGMAASSLGVLAMNASSAPAQFKGRIKQAACSSIYGKFPLDEFLARCPELGIVGMDFAKKDIWPLLKERGLVATLVSGAGSIKNGLNNKAKHADFLNDFKKNIAAAAEYQWPNVICMAGDRQGISDEEGAENCILILKEAAKIAEDHGVTICMELLNSKVDHPGYMCDHTAWGVEVCKAVASPRVKLLYDIYHMQIMEGDIIRTIKQNIDYIGHFHTAGNPGRKDLDDQQELYYPPIMRAIADLQEQGKYHGYVAHEFSPKNKWASLIQAIEVCDV